jgi:hypothetical protein
LFEEAPLPGIRIIFLAPSMVDNRTGDELSYDLAFEYSHLALGHWALWGSIPWLGGTDQQQADELATFIGGLR